MEQYFRTDNTEGYSKREIEKLNELANAAIENPEDCQEIQNVCERIQRDFDSSAEVEITSFSVYEKDNGFEIVATKNGIAYKVYAQLPDCPDSEHSFLDDNNDEEILEKIVAKVSELNGNLDLSVWCKLGSVCNYSHKEYNDYYVAVDDSDSDNYVFAKESRYSDYYNTFMLSDLDEHDNEDEELMQKLNELLKELQN